jgi:hypothetical protein
MHTFQVTVVGVLPPGFRYLSSRAQIFRPFAHYRYRREPQSRHSNDGQMIARLAPNRSIAQAQSQLDVLIEGPSADSELVWQARMSTQAPEIDGVCYISDPGEAPLQAGEFRRMRIVKAHDYDLTGELVDTPVPLRSSQLVQVLR